MSKVVHLSDDAHGRAKDFCKDNGLRMSDWVAALIEEAIATGRTDPTVPTVTPKKKILDRLQSLPPPVETEAVPVYAKPPFWAGRGAAQSK